MTIRVLIADDQAVVRAGFRTILDAEPDFAITGEAADGAEAVRLARRDRPDLVLMDVRMPVLDGIAATERLAGPAVDDPIPVLIVTTFDLDEYVFDALRGGACGFLLKDIEPDDLVQAVRVVVSGQGLLAPAVTRRLIAEYARASRAARPGPRPIPDLTARERDMLLLIARGLSNAEIAGTLFLSISTIKTHVARLLAKIDCRDRVQAVIYAYEHGLITPGDPP
ncbi:response regulator [Actinomadura algeriensis]|uniref:DNA-binding NarL/FixJ family response regulator n=1 Tax=Actinomadura algeriensis TaxID=1679523 RepID=A0ABR9JMA0_9ACTN|nr:response regulator transcription factor [Actinomadura algeriensis]MBE1531682.1 DNA-binding NarL/FixJ family response regulator [Actinomadura algeriensis]